MVIVSPPSLVCENEEFKGPDRTDQRNLEEEPEDDEDEGR